MKYIKLSLVVAALLTIFASCTKRTFDPVVGDTKVEFVNPNMQINLNGAFHYIPVQAVEQSTTSAVATIELVSGTITLASGETRDVVETAKTDSLAGDIIFTSKQIFIAPYDSLVHGTGLPYANVEFRLPKYKEYQSIELNFRLVGDNVADNAEMTYIAEKPAGVVIEGSYTLQCSVWPEEPMTVNIIKVDDTNYRWGYVDAANGEVSATKDGNTLTLSYSDYYEYNGAQLYYRACDGSSIIDAAVEVTFDGAGFVLDNGIFFGNLSTASGYIIALPGDTAVKN